LTSVTCPACGAPSSPWAILRDRMHSLGGTFPAYRCQHCRTVFLEPQPNSEELRAHYPEDYAVWRGEPPPPQNGIGRGRIRDWVVEDRLGAALAARALSRLMGVETFALARNYRGPARLLDVGSGRGEVLDSFARLGWATTGIEPGTGAAAQSRARGHEIIEGDFEAIEVEGTFDLVVFSHSLEHMRDPRAALARARRLLSEEGRIFVATPNSAGALQRLTGRNWWQLDAPRHLVVLSGAGLRLAAGAAGLRIARMTTHSVPMGPLVSWRLARDRSYTIEDWSIEHEARAAVLCSRVSSLVADLVGVGDNLHAVLEVAP
jgi:SAM-dependent methyltransferase